MKNRDGSHCMQEISLIETGLFQEELELQQNVLYKFYWRMLTARRILFREVYSITFSASLKNNGEKIVKEKLNIYMKSGFFLTTSFNSSLLEFYNTIK